MKLTAISLQEEQRVGDLKIMAEKFFVAGVLELFVNVAAMKMNLGLENGKVENEYWGRKYL